MLTEKEIEVLKLRRKKGTQTRVAQELHISQAAVSLFEKNAYKKVDDALKTLEYAEKKKMEAKNE